MCTAIVKRGGTKEVCMSETVKKEKEDFKKLYEGIQNDVVRERIRASGEWYIERATKYKRIFFILSAIGIIAPLLVTVIISAGLNHTDGGSDMAVRIVIAACSALASFSSTFMVVLKCKEKWTNYRNTVEQIKSELVYYSIDEETDCERLKKLVDRTEKIMREEHGRWNEILMMQTVITWSFEEKVFRTRGLDADQTEAAIKATMKMLNIIENEYENNNG